MKRKRLGTVFLTLMILGSFVIAFGAGEDIPRIYSSAKITDVFIEIEVTEK